MDKKLESRIARLEKFVSSKPMKNEDRVHDMILKSIDEVAMHLKDALNAMKRLLAYQRDAKYTLGTVKETERDIERVTDIYNTYL